MTEGLVFECFYTRRYRPLRGKMTTFMAVIFLWQFPPLYFAIFSGNSNPDSLFLLFGLPESPNGNSHPYFLPFYPKRAILAPYFCYFARRNGLEAAQAQPASGKQRQNGVGSPAGAARPGQEGRQRPMQKHLQKHQQHQQPRADTKKTTTFPVVVILERKTGLGPATSTLARLRSTN